MSCQNCGESAVNHRAGRKVYRVGLGWSECELFIADSNVSPSIHLRGRATARKLYEDTKAFRERVVKEARLKGRKV